MKTINFYFHVKNVEKFLTYVLLFLHALKKFMSQID